MDHPWPRTPGRGQRASVCGVLALIWAGDAHAADTMPMPPATAAVNPIHVEPGKTQPIAFVGAVFRINVGTKIGTYLGSQKHDMFWQKSPGRTHEFDVVANDRLREVGYDVVDSTASAFDDAKQEKTRLQLGVVITRINNDIRGKRDFWAATVSDDSYGTTEFALEVQLQDADAQKILYRKQVNAWGLAKGRNPLPMFPAFLNGLDHALSDPDFVAAVRKDQAPDSPPVAANNPLIIPRCESDSALRLPDQVGALLDAVVTIRSGTTFGSGVIVSPAGLVLTAAHVVSGRQTMLVRLKSGIELDGSVLRIDEVRDVAIVQLQGHTFPCAVVSRELPSVGAEIFAIGTPMDTRLINSVSRGIVSGLREIDGHRLIQTDAALNPGTSGGPLFDSHGRVRAIVSSGMPGQGLAFGIPLDVCAERLALDFK